MGVAPELKKMLLRMRIASYWYAYPEFVYLAFLQVYRVLLPRIVSYLLEFVSGIVS